MEQSLSDLLSDAFSDTSVPSFPDGDLDFENLNFDEQSEDDKSDVSHENLPTKEDRAPHQEATTVLSSMETKDIYMAEDADEDESDDNDGKDFQGVGVGLASMDRALEEDYTSSDGESEQEGSVSEDEEDEEEDTGTGEEPGDLLMSVSCSNEFSSGNKEDSIFAEGQPLASEGAENPQVRNEEQGESESESESESDEEVSYFEQIPNRGNEMTLKGEGTEEDEQEREEERREDLSDSECEGVKVEQEEDALAQCFEQEVENPHRGGPTTATLEFPELSGQNLQDLIAEVDNEEYADKMKDFSGEEHQEAGESFADYPSDFSCCEYVEEKNQESNSQSKPTPHASDRGSDAKQNTWLEGAMKDITWMGREEGTDEEGDGYLYSRDLEMEADKFKGFHAVVGETVENVLADAAGTGGDDGGETGESDSYSSSDDEVQVRRRGEELLDNMYLQEPENSKTLEDTWLYSARGPTDFSMNWDFDTSIPSEDLLTAEDTGTVEMLLSDASQHHAQGVNSYSAVQREDGKTTSPSYQGSVDDSFFFNTELEASVATELGQLGDDEYEEERNWEQEQERIKAFYKFYNDSDGENEREERQIKVQFCTDPLSQVIHYETDSSDRDSLSSSTDREEDLSSAETSEELREPDNTLQMIPACDPPNALPQLPESEPESEPENEPENDLSNTQICTRKHKCLGMLKLILKMGLVIGTGLLMFWLATDQPNWLSQASFF